jgi:uncharacterized membrane protein HdeD (DUF308 family)
MGNAILGKSWWTWVLAGLGALAFGIILLAWNEPTVATIELIAGIFLIAYGVFACASASSAARKEEKYYGQLALGVIAIIAGVLIFSWPGMTSRVVLYLLAIWAIVSGVVQLYTALSVRGSGAPAVLFAVAGAVSLLFGIILIAKPSGGATAITWLIGVYGIVFGALYVIIGFEMRHLGPPEEKTA